MNMCGTWPIHTNKAMYCNCSTSWLQVALKLMRFCCLWLWITMPCSYSYKPTCAFSILNSLYEGSQPTSHFPPHCSSLKSYHQIKTEWRGFCFWPWWWQLPHRKRHRCKKRAKNDILLSQGVNKDGIMWTNFCAWHLKSSPVDQLALWYHGISTGCLKKNWV